MLFNSYLFIFLFLPLSLIGFFILGSISARGALKWLVGASFIFYAWWDLALLWVLILSIGINYGLGLHVKNNKKWLAAGIIFNLSLLAYFKYAHFLITNINIVVDTNFTIGEVLLPLAISFFTFEQIAYLVDSYKGLCKERDFLKYTLFITFFPQLIAGPIVHHQEMMPQFASKRIFNLNYKNLSIGSTLFFIGLFKKVVIADHLSLFASPVFNAVHQGEVLTFFEAWGGTLAYTFQLYFDFSGYTDMALGLAWLFGIKLPQNFNSPYKAKSIIDFWRRWHITLSNFLRDYLYIPLGGNRTGKTKRYINLMLTMLIGGLWHGAGWTYLVWGGLHGFYLIVNHLFRKIVSISSFSKGRSFDLFAQLLTFGSVMIAWVFFRAATIGEAFSIIKSLFLMNGLSLPQSLMSKFSSMPNLFALITFDGLFSNNLCHWPQGFCWIMFATGVAFGLPNSNQLLSRYQKLSDRDKYHSIRWVPTRSWAALMIVMTVLSLLNLGQMSEFLYFQF